MPDIAAKELDGGHDLKTSLVAGFERNFIGSKHTICTVSGFVRFFSRASRWIQMQIIMIRKE